MTMLAHRQLPPSAQDAAIARVSGQLLSRYARQKRPLTLRVHDAGEERSIELPAGAVALLMDILEAMAAGQCQRRDEIPQKWALKIPHFVSGQSRP